MSIENKPHKGNLAEVFALNVTKATGSIAGFIIAFALVILWGVTGPVFHYSENWQLVINTGTTIITFLMVFLIQKSQNYAHLSNISKTEESLQQSHSIDEAEQPAIK